MSRLRIFAEADPATPLLTTTDHGTIAARLGAIGVRFEQWRAGAELERVRATIRAHERLGLVVVGEARHDRRRVYALAICRRMLVPMAERIRHLLLRIRQVQKYLQYLVRQAMLH